MQLSHHMSSMTVPYSQHTRLDAKFIALPSVMTLILKVLEMHKSGFLLLDSTLVSAWEIVGMFPPHHTISSLASPSHLLGIKSWSQLELLGSFFLITAVLPNRGYQNISHWQESMDPGSSNLKSWLRNQFLPGCCQLLFNQLPKNHLPLFRSSFSPTFLFHLPLLTFGVRWWYPLSLSIMLSLIWDACTTLFVTVIFFTLLLRSQPLWILPTVALWKFWNWWCWIPVPFSWPSRCLHPAWVSLRSWRTYQSPFGWYPCQAWFVLRIYIWWPYESFFIHKIMLNSLVLLFGFCYESSFFS